MWQAATLCDNFFERGGIRCGKSKKESDKAFEESNEKNGESAQKENFQKSQ